MDFFKDFLPIVQLLPDDIQKENNLSQKTYDPALKLRAIKALKKYIEQTKNYKPSIVTQMSTQLTESQLKAILTDMHLIKTDILSYKDELQCTKEMFNHKIDNCWTIFENVILNLKISSENNGNIDIVKYKIRNQELEEANQQLQHEIQNLKASILMQDDIFVSQLIPNQNLSTSQFGGEQNATDGEKMVNYDKYRELKDKYRTLHDANKVMKVQIKMYQEQLANMDPLLKQYEEKQNVDQLCNALNESNNQMRISTSNLFIKNQQLQRIINEKDKEIQEKQQQVQILQDQIKRLKNLSSNFKDGKKAYPWVISDITILDDFQTLEQHENPQPTQRMSTIDKVNADLVDPNQVSNLKMQVVKLNQDIKSYKIDLKAKDEIVQAQTLEIQQLEKQISILQSKIQKQDGNLYQIKELREQIEQLCADKIVAQAQYDRRLQEAKADLADAMRGHQSQINAQAEVKLAQHEQVVKNAVHTIQNIRDQLGNIHHNASQFAQISFVLNTLMTKIRILSGQKQNVSLILQQTQEKLQEYKIKIEQLESQQKYNQLTRQSDIQSQNQITSLNNQSTEHIRNAQFNLSNEDVSLLKMQIEQLEREIATNQEIINIKDELLEKKQSIIQDQQEQLNELGQSLISQSQLLHQQKSHIEQQAHQLEEQDGLLQYQNDVNERQRLQISAFLDRGTSPTTEFGALNSNQPKTVLSMRQFAQNAESKSSGDLSGNFGTEKIEKCDIPNEKTLVTGERPRGALEVEDLGGGTSRKRVKSKQIQRLVEAKEELEDELFKERRDGERINKRNKIITNSLIVVILATFFIIFSLIVQWRDKMTEITKLSEQIRSLKARLNDCMKVRNQLQANNDNFSRILSSNDVDLSSLHELVRNGRQNLQSCQKTKKNLVSGLIASSLAALASLSGIFVFRN